MASRPLEPEIVGRPAARELIAGADLAVLSRRSDRSGAARLLAHAAVIAAAGAFVWAALGRWWLLLPAMLVEGIAIVTLFAPMHECVHRTAFASRRANVVVGWLAGVLCFYNSTFYRYFHSWHHRYTQDPARDPELLIRKADTRLAWAREIAGANFWWRRALDYPRLALGLPLGLPFVPEQARRPIAWSMSGQLGIYLAAAATIAAGSLAPLYFWLLPVVLAQPVLRAILIVEHTGCGETADGFSNTRTTLASLPLRLLMWNMPFHAEHHLYPAVPFHQLPALHRLVGPHLRHLAPGYPAANREVMAGLVSPERRRA